MDPPDAAAFLGRRFRCDHCGRPVDETRHTRTSYRVDYYALHTGAVEECSLMTEDGQRSTTYLKLINQVDVVTCADCYRHEAVQLEREQRFRPERSADEGGDRCE